MWQQARHSFITSTRTLLGDPRGHRKLSERIRDTAKFCPKEATAWFTFFVLFKIPAANSMSGIGTVTVF
jgi:hypothetical protein